MQDGIYPEWGLFLKAIPARGRRQPPEVHFFNSRQMGQRKEVERAFGVLLVRGSSDFISVLLQQRFQILQRGARMWRAEDVTALWRCCMILHNMIVEDERELGPEAQQYLRSRSAPRVLVNSREPAEFLLRQRRALYHTFNRGVQEQLREDIKRNLWENHFRRGE